MRALAYLCAAVVWLSAAAAASADVQDLPDPYSTANGTVFDVDLDGDHLVLGGAFQRLGRRTGPMVAAETTTGAIDPRLPEFDSEQRVAAADGTGGWYLPRGAGSSQVIGRFADGRWDPGFEVPIDGPLQALERIGDVLYVGGHFRTVAGTERRGAAALDVRTAALLPWSPPTSLTGGGAPSAFRALGDRIFMLGYFQPQEASATRDVVAVDAETGAARDFPLETGPGVTDIEVAGDRLFVAGGFDSVGGTERRGVVEVDPETARPRPFDAGLDGGVVNDMAIDVASGALYLAGHFQRAHGEPRSGFAAVDLTTGLPGPWEPRPGGAPATTRQFGQAVALSGDHVAVSGRDPANVVAVVDRTSGRERAWSMRPDSLADRLVGAQGQVVVSGTFAAADALSRRGLAVIRASDGAPAGPPLPAVAGEVHALDRRGDVIYLGGPFTSVGGLPRSGLAAVDARTGAVLPWAPEVEGEVRTLAAGPDAVFAGGRLVEVAGVAAGGLAAFDPTTGAALDGWQVDRGDIGVTDLELSGDRLLVSGDFETVNGVPRAGVAAMSAGTGAVDGWRPATDDLVRDIALDGDRIYLGGEFSHVGSKPRTFAAAVDPVDGAVLDWAPAASGPVGRIGPGGDRVYLAGALSPSDNPKLPRDMLAVVDRASGAPLQPIDMDGLGVRGGVARDVVATPYRVVVGGMAPVLFDTPLSGPTRGVRAGGLASFTTRPLNLEAPRITGESRVGATLACSAGRWAGMEGELAYAWRRRGVPQPVGTGPTYVATEDDHLSGALWCVVTAVRGDRQTEAESASVSLLPAPPAASSAPPLPPAPRRQTPAAAPLTSPGVRPPALRSSVLRRSARRLVLRLRCSADCRVLVRIRARGGRRCAMRVYRLRAGKTRTVRVPLRSGGGCRRSGRRISIRLR